MDLIIRIIDLHKISSFLLYQADTRLFMYSFLCQKGKEDFLYTVKKDKPLLAT